MWDRKIIKRGKFLNFNQRDNEKKSRTYVKKWKIYI